VERHNFTELNPILKKKNMLKLQLGWINTNCHLHSFEAANGAELAYMVTL
jgi:hypothetical protein